MGELNSIINVDLHIHSFKSEYKENDSVVKDSTIENLDVILQKLDDSKIGMFSFTDHNRFSFELYENALIIVNSNKFANVKKILPGVEFDVLLENDKEPCHLIAIFEDSDSEKLRNIETLLDDGKYSLKNNSDYFDVATFEELLFELKIPVILIGCQRQGLENKNVDTNSFNMSCSDPCILLKAGYISALEYQTPRVQGIILNDLRKLDIETPLVCGSDCHEWAAYPFHDKNQKRNSTEPRYFSIKSLPSFLGLLLALTSPKTRFKREEGPRQYIKKFSINGCDVELSNGFNAIIGENGSGKSTLLSGLCVAKKSLQRHEQSFLKNNNFVFDENVDRAVSLEGIKMIKQNEIINNNINNSDNIFGDSTLFQEPDNSAFINSIYEYEKTILSKIETHIDYEKKKEALKETSFVYRTDFENFKAFYIIVQISNDFSVVLNEYRTDLKNINSVCSILSDLYKSPQILEKEKKYILDSFASMKELRNIVLIRYNKKELESKVKNIIQLKVVDYNKNISQKSSDYEVRVQRYKQSKLSLVDSVSMCIKAKIAYEKIQYTDIDTKAIPTENTKYGFKFICTPAYAQDTGIKEKYLAHCFNDGYAKEEKISEISSVTQANTAVFRSANDFKTKLNQLTKDFVEEKIAKTYFVQDILTKSQMGTTLGEKSLVFYKYISNVERDYKVFAIDQPEDNISNYKIFTELISYFSSLRDKYQLIFVTHNPMLVVNLDVDNVIYLKKENNLLNINYGALESPDILQNVADVMDGGKEAILKRLKVYE